MSENNNNISVCIQTTDGKQYSLDECNLVFSYTEQNVVIPLNGIPALITSINECKKFMQESLSTSTIKQAFKHEPCIVVA